MKIDILRRIAERGKAYAEKRAAPPPYPQYENWDSRKYRKLNRHYLDLFQHMLDELERTERGSHEN